MKKQNHIIYKIYRKKTIKHIEGKIKLLGVYCNYDTLTFLNIRFLLSILIFVVLFFFTNPGYLIAPILTILFYILFEKIILDYPIKKRCKKLENEAIFFFEVLNLTLDSNRNIKNALELTSNNISSELSEEFKKMLSEIKLGKSFKESLIAMKERIPSEAINNLILSLTEASVFGINIGKTLNNQLEYLREKQILETKAEITKLPTKISIISVLFFIPIMLLIILAPVIINFLLK